MKANLRNVPLERECRVDLQLYFGGGGIVCFEWDIRMGMSHCTCTAYEQFGDNERQLKNYHISP